ncbi:Endonuclease/exonuclease/phosphatase,Reverse transcriptase domain [Cinara cedri]|uniref:Endonuclease/exonuclease/phosphatase,Reverse transcriptase domain n=1 Tax=Cinara cedri TaxID=506608 RepID=A0A5E4MS94_9HEMI|nr:Endonuclease/exonuclease/phosphatase,Reverse transcriptase domain [Cinara cedri]
MKVGHYIVYFSGLADGHYFGSGFAVHEKLETYVKEFIPISERMSCLKLNTTPINIILVCVHAWMETSEDEVKDGFYNKLDETWDSLCGNTVKIMLGDLNAKCGREPQYAPTIGKESLHAINNRNRLQLISFTVSNNIVVRSTTFPHKNIHRATWKSPDGNMLNQIVHILIENRFQSSIKNIRSYRGADTDHFLLISKFKLKLQGMKSLKERKIKKYVDSIDTHLKDRRTGNIETDWNKINLVIKEKAERSIGGVQNGNTSKKKKLYNETIGQYKDFNPTLKAIKGSNGDTLMEPNDKAKRWREYFIDLLNAEIPVNRIGNTQYQTAEPMISFADDLNIIGNTRDDLEKATKVLEKSADEIGLKINIEKMKIMELLDTDADVMDPDPDDWIYEKVNEFKYLGVCVNTKNDWSQEIGLRIMKVEKASFALSKFFKSKMLSKKTKIRLYTVIVRVILTYGCEAWTYKTISVTERRLTTFENKLWRAICGHKLTQIKCEHWYVEEKV